MFKLYPSLVLLYIAQFIGLSWGQSCYSPNGALSSSHFPCYPSAHTSLCCPMGWTCFSSNLCMVTDTGAAGSQFPIGTAQRGGCTNAKGDNDLCGDYCLDSDNDSMISCGSSRFCCGSKAKEGLCNCETGEGTFAAEGGKAETVMGQEGMVKTATEVQSTGLTASASKSSSILSTLSTATTTGNSTSSASKTSKTASGSVTEITVENTSSPTALVSPSASIPFAQRTGFMVMIGVLAVAAAAILIAGLILWRKKKNRSKENYPGPFGDNASSIDLSDVPHPNHLRRPDPDPYYFPPMTGSAMAGTPTETRERRFRDAESPLNPPVLDPYRLPSAMRNVPAPYEGT